MTETLLFSRNAISTFDIVLISYMYKFYIYMQRKNTFCINNCLFVIQKYKSRANLNFYLCNVEFALRIYRSRKDANISWLLLWEGLQHLFVAISIILFFQMKQKDQNVVQLSSALFDKQDLLRKIIFCKSSFAKHLLHGKKFKVLKIVKLALDISWLSSKI